MKRTANIFGLTDNDRRAIENDNAVDEIMLQTPAEREDDDRAREQHAAQDRLFARGGYRSCFSAREDGEPRESASLQQMTDELEF